MSIYLYHVEKRINDILRGKPVPDVAYVPEDETYNDVCYTYATHFLTLDESGSWEWNFDKHRSYNGIYVCWFNSTDDKPLQFKDQRKLSSKTPKRIFVHIDLNKSTDLSKLVVSWYE